MKKLVFLSLFFSVFFSSCGVSPILNHQDASAEEKSVPVSNCPLAFPNHGLCAELDWNAAPNDEDEAIFSLRFWKTAQGTEKFGPYVDPSESVNVMIWMPAMGHGSSPIHLAHATDLTGAEIPGIFLGSAVYFLMPGAWDVHVQLKDGSTVSEEAVEPIQI